MHSPAKLPPWSPRRRVVAALVPFTVVAWIAACAADPGDPPKSAEESGGTQPPPAADDDAAVDVPITPVEDSSIPPSDDSSEPMQDTSSPPVDTGVPTDTAAVDVPANNDAPPPTGCASGATVIAMTALGNVNFDTAGAVCITYMGNVDGWNASNVQGRSVTVVGSTTQSPAITGDNLPNQPGIMPGADGYVYWNYTAGQVNYSSMATF
jgi:cytoskeletal protein RodZ